MRVLLVSIVIIIVDQVSKLYIRSALPYARPHRIIGDYLRVTYVENPGMAFGIQITGQAFFTVFAFIATLIILVYLYKARGERFVLRFSLALILGGAVGNLIDRILYKKVVDFIDIGIGVNRWPIFNVADSAVSIGMVMLIVLILLDRTTQPRENDERAAV